MPTDDAVTELRRQFRGGLPASVEALDEQALRDLAGALRASRRTQTTLLSAAAENSLEHVPRLIRPLVRKVIGL